MKLLIDAGNTRLKWAICDEQGHLSGHGVAGYDRCHVPDEVAALWCGKQDVRSDTKSVISQDISEVWLASVVTSFEQGLREWFSGHGSCPVYTVESSAAEYGLKNAYVEPQNLGIDRWLSLLAARQLSQSKVVMVADCGSALTLDVIEADQHLGGLIVPGVEMMRASLHQGADALSAPVQKKADTKVVISDLGLADTTSGCIDQGVAAANVAVIERLAGQLQAEHQGQLELIICGGAAPQLLPMLGSAYHHVEDLVLQGLAIKAGSGV